ncbi:hypothetical protein, partial [Escherichia coli]|uniref:hypothetical protein n=1 Tax=Escherichia coli TaxID=562 RepID=UPI003EDEE71A
LGVIFLLNYISVRGFGEAEYWFSLIKVTTVIVFITAAAESRPACWNTRVNGLTLMSLTSLRSRLGSV